jgi:type IV pilus assembly protein PilW
MKTFSLPELSRRQSHVRGFSLIELLVSMAIGLIVTLAITTVMVRNEGQKRTSTVLNDASQTGAYAALTLDRAMRSAGSGFTQFRGAMGCFLNASIGSGATQILPPLAALPAPFANIGTATVPIRLAPVVIVDGGQLAGVDQPDQLIVMAGTHGFSETPLTINPSSVAVASMGVQTTLGLSPGDLVLVADSTAGGPCMVQQVGAVVAASQTLPLAGAYYDSTGFTATGAAFPLTSFNALQRASVLPIGSIPAAGAANPPMFFAYGVDTTSAELKSYDLLQTTGTSATVAEGVVGMQAIYGVGTATLSASAATPAPITPLVWTAPTAALYTASNTSLLSPAGGQANLPNIQAVRVALIVRSPLKEKEDVAPANIVLFPDLAASLQVNFPVSAAQQKFRHRVVDFVIPLRNL